MDTVKTKTVSPSNNAFYTHLANTWWDKKGPLWPIHTLNAVRVEYLARWISHFYCRQQDQELPLKGIRILDVGCGGGVLSECMARLGASVTGIDVVERNIHVARHHAQQAGIHIDYKVSSVEALVEQRCEFDVVLNMEVVEHVTNLTDFLQSCTQLVRPGGMMFIATINRTHISWFTAILGAEYLLRWLPRGTHQWRMFRKPRELIEVLDREHMQVMDQVGVKVNPFSRKMRLSKTTSINYMIAAQKPDMC